MNVVSSGALFSECKKYRYSLWREWEPNATRVTFIGLNPSTADETVNDPTIRRCIGYAKDWGYGGINMLNLFAYRSTDPKGLTKVEDPVGALNNFYLESTARTGFVVAAWGTHGTLNNREEEVLLLLNNKLHHLGLTKNGHTKHPLYLPKNIKPTKWMGV